MKPLSIVSLSAALALSIGGMAAPTAFAQTAQQQQQMQQAPAQTQNVNDQEVKACAKAAMKIKEIKENYAPKFEQAKDDKEQQSIRQTATDEMVKAIENEGLTVEKYQTILVAARTDPNVADRMKQYMDEVE